MWPLRIYKERGYIMTYCIKVEKTHSEEEWAALEESFAKEGRSKEECAEFRRIIINLDQQMLHNDRKHRRCCSSLDAYNEREKEKLSLSSLEYNLDDPLVNYYCKDPETLYIEQETREEMLSILEELPDNYRECLIARYYLGFNNVQYAQMKGKTAPWAQQLHCRAKKRLKKLLEEKYMNFVSEVY
jgi:RNA polymerase sigma factor (sigma-70 family)